MTGPAGSADEEELDRCWDLLRQRRAKREFGRSPDDATVRPVVEVEGYLQCRGVPRAADNGARRAPWLSRRGQERHNAC